jgi:outer membrane protein assembly factor BamE (lipoprotein component of BamABCDE complex)
MKKALLLILVLSFLLQVGCTKAVRYTEEEIKSYPANIQDNIRKAQIDLGMKPEQVRYAWGSPDSIKILDPFEGKAREEWIYSSAGTLGVVGTKILLFYDGKLIYIK